MRISDYDPRILSFPLMEPFLCSISELSIWENLKKQLLKKCPGQGAHRKLLFHIIYAYP